MVSRGEGGGSNIEHRTSNCSPCTATGRVRGSRFEVRGSRFNVQSRFNAGPEARVMSRVVVIISENGEKGAEANQGDHEGFGDGFTDSELLLLQPEQNKSQIARRQQLDQVRRPDMQRPGPVFPMEMDVEAGANEGAGRRDRVESGTSTARTEEIIGFANGDVMEGVVRVDLELAKGRWAKRNAFNTADVEGVGAIAPERVERDNPFEWG